MAAWVFGSSRGWSRAVDLRMLHVAREPIGDWAALLDEGEIERSTRFRLDPDRRRFILGRGLLRVMLGETTGRAPRTLRFGATPVGKPTLEGAEGWAFNVAHSGDYVMAAVARARAIGVDIEKHRPDFDLLRLSERTFTSGEHRVIAEAPDARRTTLFFRQWVFKEAFLKGLGTGFSVDSRRYEIVENEDAVTVSAVGETSETLPDWELHEVAIGQDYSAAVALLA